MKDSIIEIEHRPGGEIVLRFKSPGISAIPAETIAHFVTAQKEMLLALRSLLDSAIKYAEQAEKPGTKKRSKIDVQ